MRLCELVLERIQLADRGLVRLAGYLVLVAFDERVAQGLSDAGARILALGAAQRCACTFVVPSPLARFVLNRLNVSDPLPMVSTTT